MKARQHLGEILSAYEFLDKEALALTLKEVAEARDPLPNAMTKFYVLIETAGSNAAHDSAKMKARKGISTLTSFSCRECK